MAMQSRSVRYKVNRDGSLKFMKPKPSTHRLKPLPATPSTPQTSSSLHFSSSPVTTPETNDSQALIAIDQELAKHSSSVNASLDFTNRLAVPDALLTTRESAAWLENSLAARLAHLRQTDVNRHEFVLKSQEIFNDVAAELTRQVSMACTDRGRLLAKLWTRYSDLINIFAQMFVNEKQQHQEEEDKANKQLVQARLDYVQMVQKSEELIRTHHKMQTKMLAEQAAKEQKLCDEIVQLKEDLYRAQAALRAIPPMAEASPLLASGSQFLRQSSVQSVSALEHQGSLSPFGNVETKKLRAELESARLTLLDATSELQILRSQKEKSVSRAVQTVADPYNEDEDEKSAFTASRSVTPAVKNLPTPAARPLER